MTFTPKTAYIVSHTHWDREWYLSYHTFRTSLVRVVRRVLAALEDDGAFEHFLLDGQSVILEDYLEVHPEDEQRICEHVTGGRLSVGPWYILPDEFLISAEAHARNLLYGHKVAGRFGSVQKAGYMPDSFGHVAQMPQLLNRAGIDSFIYTRGNGDELAETGHEYIWQAPDESEVLAINQCGGYCNTSGLGFDEIWHAHTRREVKPERAKQQLRELFEKMGPLSNGDIVLLNNGCDHFPPQQEFATVLAALKEEFPSTEFKHASLSDYLDAVRQAGFAQKRFCGELAGGAHLPILSGVWSARMYMKQQNDEAQQLLSGVLEPLLAYTHFSHGREYPAGQAEYAWKLLLKNHPHDSICGCSTDEVHREMLPRFSGVIETARQLAANELEDLAPTFARQAADDRDTVLCVFNPLPVRRTEVVERLVVLQPLGYDLDKLALLDEEGQPVPFTILERWLVERFWGVDYRTMLDAPRQLEKFQGYLDAFGPRIMRPESERDASDCSLHIQFAADLPPLGHVNYRLTDKSPAAHPAQESGEVAVNGQTIENAQCQVVVHPDGTFDLHDKLTGASYPGLNMLESTEDIGDEYDYSPAADGKTITAEGLKGEMSITRPGGLAGAIRIDFDIELPRGINAKRDSRLDETVSCPVSATIGLKHGSPVVTVDLEFGNNAKDHRLRALFPTGLKAQSVISDGHFYVNERPIEPPSGADWVQPHPGTYPQQDFSLLQDGSGGLALFNRGLPEVAPLTGGDGGAGLALTLLRCTGWLSRDDFPTRRFANAGPTVPTPEAQCQGRHRFSYAVAPFGGSWLDAGIRGMSQRWRTNPLTVQGVEDQSVPGGGGLVEMVSDRACITAIKQHDTRDTLVLRLYNQSAQPAGATIRFAKPVLRAWRTDLLEERQQAIKSRSSNELNLELAPCEISTIEIEFKT